MKEGKTYIGIDPGSKGFVSVLYDTGERDFCDLVSNNYHSVADFLRNVSERSKGRVVCCMEEIHAVFGSSAKGTFSFGEVYGVLQGILVALKIPYHLVSPAYGKRRCVSLRILYILLLRTVQDAGLTINRRQSIRPAVFSPMWISVGLRNVRKKTTTSVTRH